MTRTMLESDSDVQQAILRELAWDTRVKATEIGVAVDRGVVTLTGAVNSYGKKVAAGEAAHRVRGVLDVANDVTVTAPGLVRSDADIAHAVRDALEWNLFVPDKRIATTVADGIVTLDGEVDTLYERNEAEAIVQHLGGVRAVHNHVTITHRPVDRDAVRAAIDRALDRRAAREAERIALGVSDGAVALAGSVRSSREKQAILGALSHAPGVRSVEDNLTIEPEL